MYGRATGWTIMDILNPGRGRPAGCTVALNLGGDGANAGTRPIAPAGTWIMLKSKPTLPSAAPVRPDHRHALPPLARFHRARYGVRLGDRVAARCGLGAGRFQAARLEGPMDPDRGRHFPSHQAPRAPPRRAAHARVPGAPRRERAR